MHFSQGGFKPVKRKHLATALWLKLGSIILLHLTLRRARGAASGVLGDVDSLAVSDVELKEELLLDSSLLDGRLVANCRTGDAKVKYVFFFCLILVEDNEIYPSTDK